MHEQLSSGHNCHAFGITTALLMITPIEVDLLGKHHLNKGGFCRSMWEVVSSIKHSDLAFKAKSTTTVSTWCLSLWLSARKSEIKKNCEG